MDCESPGKSTGDEQGNGKGEKANKSGIYKLSRLA